MAALDSVYMDLWETISIRLEPMTEGTAVFYRAVASSCFVLAVKLSEAGLVTWGEWSATLAAYLRTPHANPVTLQAPPHLSLLPASGEREGPAQAGG